MDEEGHVRTSRPTGSRLTPTGSARLSAPGSMRHSNPGVRVLSPAFASFKQPTPSDPGAALPLRLSVAPPGLPLPTRMRHSGAQEPAHIFHNNAFEDEAGAGTSAGDAVPRT